MILSPIQEDYLELIFRLSKETSHPVRITDLASHLLCKMPTVTRTIKILADAGYVIHEKRGDIQLSKRGEKVASQVVHRHDDIEDFLTQVLCLDTTTAIADTCKIEHGFSPLASERLHAFMMYFSQLTIEEKKKIQKAVVSLDSDVSNFDSITSQNLNGWRH